MSKLSIKGSFIDNSWRKDKRAEIQNKNLKSGYTNYILTLSKKTVRLTHKNNGIAIFIFHFNSNLIANLIYYLIKFDNKKSE